MVRLFARLVIGLVLVTMGCGSPHSSPGRMQGTPGSQGSPGSPGSQAVILSLSPSSITAGNQDFVLIITGTGFPDSPAGYKYHPAVLWQSNGAQDGIYLPVDDGMSDSTHVTATVPASLVQNRGTFSLQVQVWFKADDSPKYVSNFATFVVN